MTPSVGGHGRETSPNAPEIVGAVQARGQETGPNAPYIVIGEVQGRSRDTGPNASSASQSDIVIGATPVTDVAFDDVLQLISDQATTVREKATTPAQTATPRISEELSGGTAAIAVPPPPPIPPVVAFGPRSSTAPAVGARGATLRRGHHDETVLLITRKAVYAQAAVVGGLVTLAFAAGLMVGRSGRPAGKASSEDKNVAAAPVGLEGYVLYALSPGQSIPDSGATVFALPTGKAPAQKIAARGLRPGDRDDLAALPAADSLRSLGATVARADKTGQFQLVVPRPGDYALLIVSHHAKRPEDKKIAAPDQQELGRVFASPRDLIGQYRYAMVSQHLAGAPRPLTHEFGPTDKK